MLLADPAGAPDRAAAGDPGWLWRYAERYLGGGTRTYSRFAADLEISPEFHPQHGAQRFLVPTYWVPEGSSDWLCNQIDSSLPALYRDRDRDRMLLPVHPEALRAPELDQREQLREPGPPLEVVPSANARTVFVTRLAGRPVPAHFLKLHYPGRLSRFTRRLRRPVIGLQLWVADELWRVGAPFLPEVAGGVIGDDPAQAWGFLLREAVVRGGAEPGSVVPSGAAVPPYTVPMFALYGRDVRRPGDPTLLEQLVDRSGEDAETWLVRRVVEPLITIWCEVLRRTGCALEPHGQNALFQFSPDGRQTRVAYRDCAVYVDPQLRAGQGLTGPLPPRNVISRDVRKPREQVFSLVYDCFLGSHLLDYLARLVAERFGVAPANLHWAARKAFAAGTGPEPLLPRTIHYYDSTLHPDGDWRLVDTGRPPVWR